MTEPQSEVSGTKWIRTERSMVGDAESVLNDLDGSPFALLHQMLLHVFAIAIAAVSLIHLSIGVELTGLAGAVAVLILTGVLVEVSLLGIERRLMSERHQTRALWERQRDELRELATKDELTQLQNRRYYYERMGNELSAATSLKHGVSLLLLDVDDLKSINEAFGHQVGDAVLRKFALVLNECSNGSHIPIRLGGDEFAVIMPGADRRTADALAWSIWETLADAPIHETDYASIYLGVSIGTSGYPWGGTNLEEITHWADTKLYANKLERKGIANLRDGQSENNLAAVVVDVLSAALDVRDRMTHRHGRRVARTAAAVARAMNLPNDMVLEIEYTAGLHDIGKVGVADSILRKAGALDEEEWREMRRHSEMGYDILNGIDFFKGAAEIVYAHHERYDGCGYPRGLAGEDVPLGARVFAVVDSYDAMTSCRLYRDVMPRQAALREIANNSGTQFDPNVVEAFIKVISLSPDGFYEEGVEDVGLRLKPSAQYDESESASVGDSDACDALVRRYSANA